MVLSLFSFITLSGCQIGYLVKSAYSQADLLRRRVTIEDALLDPHLNPEQKRKLLLAKEAREFAEKSLGLKSTQNYTTFVQLDRPYVTYVVSAAPKNELVPYKWHYPVVGSLPYKGYFNPDDAKAEAEIMKKQNLDVFVRGVSAYSTLGWFRDPILSSMLGYKDYDLVNTIIHETVHATIYIKSEADFNERLAVFFGNKGAEAFYKAKADSGDIAGGKALIDMANANHDDRLFSEFIGHELESLRKWYEERKALTLTDETRFARIGELKSRFHTGVRPRMLSTDAYKNFESAELNNARLLTYRLYYEDLNDFEVVFQKFGGDFHKMLEFCKSLEKVDDPKAELAKTAKAT